MGPTLTAAMFVMKRDLFSGLYVDYDLGPLGIFLDK